MTTPVLEGRHVRLEPVTVEMLDVYEQFAFQPSVWRWMKFKLTNRTELEAWQKEFSNKSNTLFWATVLQSTGEPVGSTQFIELDMGNLSVEIGNTWMREEVRGTSVNPEAKFLQLQYAFEVLGLRRVALKTHHNNQHSQNAMKKLGAQYEGTFRNHWILQDGSTRHTVWFSIIAEEWPAVKAGLLERIGT